VISIVDGSFSLLGRNSTSMTHCDAVRVEPSTPSDKLELVSARPVPLPVYAAQRPRHSVSAAVRLALK
ncbi:hypothetical protein, partial [Falsihalocynthiibacter sp. CO-5D18]|uniref:hypothetical protein n=1 Tax=Falsihalocynthiibacter sp. CO-5D18 TaxID=3240872 RepID=UPI00350FE9E2